jgi:hypothetical protein
MCPPFGRSSPMAGNSAAAWTAKPNGAAAAVPPGDLPSQPGPHHLPDGSAVKRSLMTTLLHMTLALAVVVVPLACTYVVVLRLARRRSRNR